MTELKTIKQMSSVRALTESAESVNPLRPVSDALDRIFTSKQDETRIQKTRRIMGDLVSESPDEELEVYVTEFQYLIDEWLDSFERETFGSRTLKQVLGE